MTVKIIDYNIDGESIPVMLINLKHRSIVSIPTQLGCAIGCTFCISSENKFTRSLTSDEMNKLIEFGLKHILSKDALVSFTGEGEPFLNLKNINETMRILDRHPSINAFRLCTSGIRPNLFGSVFKGDTPVYLQLSLHSPFDRIRKTLIPKSKPVESIIKSLREHTECFDEVAVNYVLMKDINDSDADLEALIALIDHRWIVKLNPLLDEEKYKRSDKADIFLSELKAAGRKSIAFNSVGSKISNGLYGQLTHAKNNRIC